MNTGRGHEGREEDTILKHVGGDAECRREERTPFERHVEEWQLGEH
jgi:hypothetical protein